MELQRVRSQKLALALMEIGKGYECDDVSYEEVQLWLSVV